jgi:DNA-binding MarR family transcriptional regulator
MKDSKSHADYRRIAELHHEIRRFLHLEEEITRAIGLEPRQYQVMVAIKGLPEGAKPTITGLALSLCLKHHTVVGLVNRLAERALLSAGQILETGVKFLLN